MEAAKSNVLVSAVRLSSNFMSWCQAEMNTMFPPLNWSDYQKWQCTRYLYSLISANTKLWCVIHIFSKFNQINIAISTTYKLFPAHLLVKLKSTQKQKQQQQRIVNVHLFSHGEQTVKSSFGPVWTSLLCQRLKFPADLCRREPWIFQTVPRIWQAQPGIRTARIMHQCLTH